MTNPKDVLEFLAAEERDMVRALEYGDLLRDVKLPARTVLHYLHQLNEARGRIEAAREQAVYGFTGETVANMKEPLTGPEMNRWWQSRILAILSPDVVEGK